MSSVTPTFFVLPKTSSYVVPAVKGLIHGGLWIKKTESVYSPSQIINWLARIGYPGCESDSAGTEGSEARDAAFISSFFPSLENLDLLMRLSLTAFPFENTPMHYTPEHDMDISYEGLYVRMVKSKGNGSYCFGLNGLFCQMLKGLGFRVYTSSGRINEQPAGVAPIFHAFVHMILFVQPDLKDGPSNKTYLVDVSGGPARPILLQQDESVMGASPSERHILRRTARADSSLESATKELVPLEWRLESFHKDKAQLQSEIETSRVMYSFIEDEFFPNDFMSFNYSVVGLRTGLFWDNVVCAKYFWASDEEHRAIDDMNHRDIDQSSHQGLTPLTRHLGKFAMAGNTLKRHLDTHTEVLRVMNTEEERAAALEEYFGITIPRENLKYIAGRGAELKKKLETKERAE
ncbi:hypothetical protein C8J56DRAFT_871887 [Mycena floridula]|nr:hypothetical protein C8J56DRAFT_871887 [Mycena floridula]